MATHTYRVEIDALISAETEHDALGQLGRYYVRLGAGVDDEPAPFLDGAKASVEQVQVTLAQAKPKRSKKT